METLRFLTPEQAGAISDQFGTPVYVYDEGTLKENAETCLRFPNAYGLTVRYAMKANSNAAILKTFEDLGLYFDASSGFEVERALRAEIAPEKISLSSQEIPRNLGELCEKGIAFNASSLNQISRFGELRSLLRSLEFVILFPHAFSNTSPARWRDRAAAIFLVPRAIDFMSWIAAANFTGEKDFD